MHTALSGRTCTSKFAAGAAGLSIQLPGDTWSGGAYKKSEAPRTNV